MISGILLAWFGIRLGPEPGWGWMVASGKITLLTAIIFAMNWPANTLFFLGIVLAVDLTFQGVASMALGLSLKGNR